MNTEAEVEAPAEARNMNLSQVAGEAKVGQSQSVIQRIRRGHGFSQQFSYAKWYQTLQTSERNFCIFHALQV